MKQFIGECLVRVFVVVIFLFSTGCVSKGTFQMKVDENVALDSDLKKSRSNVEALEKEIDKLNKINSKLKGDLRESSRILGERQKKLEDARRQLTDEKESAVEAQKKFFSEQNQVKETFQKSLEDLDVNKKELLARVDAMTMEISRLETENNELKKLLNETAFEKEKKARELKEAGRAHREFVKKLTNEINDGVIKISKLKNRLSVEIVDSILFDSGSAEIKGEGRKILKKVSRVLMGVKENNIRVEGHTDNIPIGRALKAKYPSNWELSSARATEVVRYLVLQGIEPEKLVPVGFSRFHPVAPNNSPEERRRNRRIEIVLFPRDIQDIVKSVDEGAL